MKAVIQRVQQASVSVNQCVVGDINRGFMILLGVAAMDTLSDVATLLNKVCGLRVFPSDVRSMDRSLQDVQGDVLIVPQFTLLADFQKGRRPSFSNAAHPTVAKPLVDAFIHMARGMPIGHVASGVFGADMQVSLVNDGPVTITLDTQAIPL